jgi:hypothetical protein
MLQPGSFELTLLACSVALRLLSWTLHTGVDIKKGRLRRTTACERFVLLANLTCAQVSLHFSRSGALEWWFAISAFGAVLCLHQQATEQHHEEEEEDVGFVVLASTILRKRWRAILQPALWCAAGAWMFLCCSPLPPRQAQAVAQFARHSALQLLAAVYCL